MDTKPPLRVVALLNVMAGSIERHPGEDIREMVRSAFAARGISSEVEAIPGGKLLDAANRALQKAQRNEVDAIVAGGGDGTIHTVAAVLAGTGVPLGILPLGTLNHFAKDLGIPLDLDGAVDVVAAAHGVNVDVGEVNGIVFINNSSIGVYPYMVLDRERLRRTGLRKWTAMALAGLHMLRVFPGSPPARSSRRMGRAVPDAMPVCRQQQIHAQPKGAGKARKIGWRRTLVLHRQAPDPAFAPVVYFPFASRPCEFRT